MSTTVQLSLDGHAARGHASAAPALPLRPYQVEALDAVTAAEARGVNRPAVVLPCGTGKTVTFAHLIARRPGRALVIAHREELLDQAADKLRHIVPSLELGVVQAERDQANAEVVLASIQTIARPSRQQRLGRDFTTVIVDECHHGSAATYVAVLEHLGAFSVDGPLCVGFTATLERADNGPLGAVWEEVAYRRTLLEMIAAGYLCDLRGLQVGTDADLAKLKVRHGDLQDAEVSAELLRSGALGQIAGAYVKHAAGRKGLAFTPSVETAYALAEALVERGIRAEALDGTTLKDRRHDIRVRLRTGETQVVVNCATLTEGFDEPSINCVLIARPTRSRVLFEQMVGRGTRLHPGKDDCLVLDLAGVTQRHDLATVAELAELDPAELEGKTLTEALAARQAREEEQERGSEDGGEEKLRLPGVTVQVPLFRSKMRWLQVGDSYVLPVGKHRTRAGEELGEGHICLVPDGDAWRVEGRRRGREPKTLADGLSLEYAQGFGEDIARRFAATLASADAEWRAKPPSAKQLAALNKWRIKVPTGQQLTAGDVSDLINTAAAKAAARKGRR
jgi:superfamily II DNA or RNA helicase